MTANKNEMGLGVNPEGQPSALKTPVAVEGEIAKQIITVEGEFEDYNELYDAIDQKLEELGFEEVVDDPESGVNIINTTDRKIDESIGYVKKDNEYYEIEVYTYFEKLSGKLWAEIELRYIGSKNDFEVDSNSIMWMEHLVHTLFDETELGFQSDEQGFFVIRNSNKVYCPFCEA